MLPACSINTISVSRTTALSLPTCWIGKAPQRVPSTSLALALALAM